jgi:hypothetical protein
MTTYSLFYTGRVKQLAVSCRLTAAKHKYVIQNNEKSDTPFLG